MQNNNLLIALYPQQNISESHLKIFYKKSNTQRTLRSRQRILRNFRVLTAEQVEMFENIFEAAHGDYAAVLKKQPLLSATERTILSFLHIGLSEAKISRNMGFTIEDLRRHVFILNKKMKGFAVQPVGSMYRILQ